MGMDLGLEGVAWIFAGVGGVLLSMAERGSRKRALIVASLCSFMSIYSVYQYGQFQLMVSCLQLVLREAALPEGVVENSDCYNTTKRDGHLALLHCQVGSEGLQPIHAWGPFHDQSVLGVGLRARVEMLQCVERSRGERRWYEVAWADVPLDSTRYKHPEAALESCGSHNPAWPAGTPAQKEVFASAINIGKFNTSLPMQVKLNKHVRWPKAPKGWELVKDERAQMHEDDGISYLSTAASVGDKQIGNVLVTWFTAQHGEENVGSPRSAPAVLVGMNSRGTIRPWEAPWPCGHTYSQGLFEVGSLEIPMEYRRWRPRESFQDFADMFLQGYDVGLSTSPYKMANDTVTLATDGVTLWAARIACFALLWLALYRYTILLGLTEPGSHDTGTNVGWAMGAVGASVLQCTLVIGINILPQRPQVGLGVLAAVVPTLLAIGGMSVMRILLTPNSAWLPANPAHVALLKQDELRQNQDDCERMEACEGG